MWTPISFGLHFGLAYALVTGAMTCRPDPIGSKEIELDLIAPRLAPPLRVNGSARDLAVGMRDDRRGDRPLSPRREQRAPHQPQREQRSRPAKRALAMPHPQRLKRAASHAQQAVQRRPRARVRPEAKSKRSQLEFEPRVAARRPHASQKGHPTDDLLRTMAAVDPEGDIPFHVAQAARKERKRRATRQAERVARQRADDARVASTLARMNTAARMAAVGASLGGTGRGRGALPRIGLRFYLSGRRVQSSRVVRPPEPLRLPRSRCTVRRLGLPPVTLRMLVSKDGDVTVAYVKRRSGDARFDRCARNMARKMRFRPGEDLAGQPLNVWIHLIVEPQVRPAQLAATPLGG